MNSREIKKVDKTELLLLDLQELQFRIKRGAEHYIPEMRRIIDEFKVTTLSRKNSRLYKRTRPAATNVSSK